MTPILVARTRKAQVSSAAAIAVTAALVVAGCGGGSSGTGTGTTPAGQANGTTSQVTPIGTVLATSSGRTVYELVGETAGTPRCTGGCQAVWPSATSGSSPLVVGGHPAHTYVRDTAAGQANGEGVTDQWGTWLALSPTGAPIPAHGGSPAPSQSSGTGGGGYGY